MNTRTEIVDEIRQAFEDTPYPGDDFLVDPPKGYENRDFDTIAEAFRGKSWQSLSDDFLLKYSEGISLLSPQGLRYFLPAYLIFGLSKSSRVQEGLVSSLTPKFEGILHEYFMERARVFTPAEKKAISLSLEYLYEEDKNYWESEPPDIRDAIRFWSGD